jgi:hypothetical protein
MAEGTNVRRTRVTAAAPPPIVVHSSLGAGRAGVVVAVGHCVELLEMEGQVDPVGVIDTVRQDRPCLVQTAAQYELVHAACAGYASNAHHAWRVAEPTEALGLAGAAFAPTSAPATGDNSDDEGKCGHTDILFQKKT